MHSKVLKWNQGDLYLQRLQHNTHNALNYNPNRRDGNKKQVTDAWNDSHQYRERLGVSCEKSGAIKAKTLWVWSYRRKEIWEKMKVYFVTGHLFLLLETKIKFSLVDLNRL